MGTSSFKAEENEILGLVCAAVIKNHTKMWDFFVEEWRAVLCVCGFGSDYIYCRKMNQQSPERKVLVHD